MKLARIISKILFFIVLIFSTATFGLIIYLNSNIGGDYKIKKGENLNIDAIVPITASYNGATVSQSSSTKMVGDTFSVDLKAFGLVPISKIEVQVIDELYVAVLGEPFGMKLYTNGVMVASLTNVKTSNGTVYPAKNAGIKAGDYILSVNGEKITTNEDLSDIVENSGGNRLKFEILRNNKKIYISFCAEKSKESNTYKLGIWVKDSSAGIGTLTFYSPSNNIICGLGHGVCDEDTEKLINIKNGNIVTAQIVSFEKGEVGKPGKLNGRFSYQTIGDILKNCECGVYSKLTGKLNVSRLTEIAMKQDVKDGPAEILCTIDGNSPKLYSCTIKIRSNAYNNKTQNLLITVDDAELLEKTGGIVQGMSGSPILQNGKLVGAVTHVLIDNPKQGFGIFAENMLETAQSVAESNKLKDAS